MPHRMLRQWPTSYINSKITVASQKFGISWAAEAVLVAKYAKLYFNFEITLLSKKTCKKMYVKQDLLFLKV